MNQISELLCRPGVLFLKFDLTVQGYEFKLVNQCLNHLNPKIMKVFSLLNVIS